MPPHVASPIRQRIREHRAKRGWTQAKLAERAGLALGTVGLAERGKHDPHHVTLDAIARAFGITVEELMMPYRMSSLSVSEPPPSHDELPQSLRGLVDLLRDEPEPVIRVVTAAARAIADELKRRSPDTLGKARSSR
ncbi:MAG: helix-turn-helix domain-containing protein [Myxococcales bacterium]|nr:helix-turn-helix domain-containing protein [Myxococcales bacterium]